MRYPRLTKRGGIYYFRAKVPTKLRAIIGKQEIVASLGTGEYEEAVRRLPAESAKANDLFDWARGQLGPKASIGKLDLTPSQIASIIQQDRRKTLTGDDIMRRRGLPYGFGRWQETIDELEKKARQLLAHGGWDDPGLDAGTEDLASATPKLGANAQEFDQWMAPLGQINEGASRNQTPEEDTDDIDELTEKREQFRSDAYTLLSECGIDPSDISDESFRLFLQTLAAAHVETTRMLQARQRGEIVETPPPPQPVNVADNRLKTVFGRYHDEKKLPPKTFLEYERAVNRFVDLFGDLPIDGIKRSMLRDFKIALAQVPSALTRTLAELPMPALLEELKRRPSTKPKLKPASINKHIGAISAILTWARDNGYFDDNPNWQNPAFGTRIGAPSSSKVERLPYDNADLRKIFQAPLFANQKKPKGGKGEAAYWLPVVALFTGARLEELGLLQPDDVKVHAKIPYISINTLDSRTKTGDGEDENIVIESTEKRTKSESSKRPVPIHKELIRLGFLDHVEEMRRRRAEWLFPDLKPDTKGQRTGNWSKWWGRWTRKLTLAHRRLKVFHSFRHSCKDALRDCVADEELRDAILGQNGRGSVGRKYGLGHELRKRNGAIQRLKYPGVTIPMWRGLKGRGES